MKIKDGITLDNKNGKYVIAYADGEQAAELTETEKFLWDMLQEGVSEKQLVSAMLLNYTIDGATAETEVYDFINLLKDAGAI